MYWHLDFRQTIRTTLVTYFLTGCPPTPRPLHAFFDSPIFGAVGDVPGIIGVCVFAIFLYSLNTTRVGSRHLLALRRRTSNASSVRTPRIGSSRTAPKFLRPQMPRRSAISSWVRRTNLSPTKRLLLTACWLLTVPLLFAPLGSCLVHCTYHRRVSYNIVVPGSTTFIICACFYSLWARAAWCMCYLLEPYFISLAGTAAVPRSISPPLSAGVLCCDLHVCMYRQKKSWRKQQ